MADYCAYEVRSHVGTLHLTLSRPAFVGYTGAVATLCGKTLYNASTDTLNATPCKRCEQLHERNLSTLGSV